MSKQLATTCPGRALVLGRQWWKVLFVWGVGHQWRATLLVWLDWAGPGRPAVLRCHSGRSLSLPPGTRRRGVSGVQLRIATSQVEGQRCRLRLWVQPGAVGS